MIDTVLVFSLICFCLIAGFLSAQIARSLECLKSIIDLLSVSKQIQSAEHEVLAEMLAHLKKPIEIPPDYKQAGTYQVGADGSLEALVRKANANGIKF